MNFEQTKQIYAQISGLEHQIAHLQEIAREVATERCEIQIGVNVINHDKLVKKDTSGYGLLPMFESMSKPEYQPRERRSVFEFEDTDCLRMLDTILRIKQEKLNGLLEQV